MFNTNSSLSKFYVILKLLNIVSYNLWYIISFPSMQINKNPRFSIWKGENKCPEKSKRKSLSSCRH